MDLRPQRLVAPEPGGEVSAVEPGSPAARAGLRAGDWIISIDGLVPRDLIDFQYETQSAPVSLVYQRGSARREAIVSKADREDLGLRFTLPVFEGIRECNNHCEFCFIAGLPKGLRRTLYIRDDDYRYSFLFGTFLTLTNLTERDWQRIGYQHLSPLNVSVHATDPWIRRQMLKNPTAPDILAQIDRLGSMGIEIFAQVVLCPGINDGATLDRTIADLCARASNVNSVAIVPVGLTQFSRTSEIHQLNKSDARVVLRLVRAWQRRLRPTLGRDFVYASDELYLLADQKMPPAWRYDGYPQLQNGVGLTRLLLRQWASQRERLPSELPASRRVIWICGQAAAPALQAIAQDFSKVGGLDVEVRPVDNQFFGGGISASGLLAGEDVRARLVSASVDLVVMPRSAFGFEGMRTVDGWSLERLERATGLPIALAGQPDELLELTLGTTSSAGGSMPRDQGR